jgi:hypothetical protein
VRVAAWVALLNNLKNGIILTFVPIDPCGQGTACEVMMSFGNENKGLYFWERCRVKLRTISQTNSGCQFISEVGLKKSTVKGS